MVKRGLVFFIFVFPVALLSNGQESPVERYGAMISADRLKDNLNVIAADSMEGRETGTRGQRMAAAFIKESFKKNKLEGIVDGDYYQPVPLYRKAPGETFLETRKRKFKNLDHVLFYGNDNSGGLVDVPLVFAGRGREEDFSSIDVQDKAVLIWIEDGRLYNLTEVARAKTKGAKMVFVWNTRDEAAFNALVNQSKVYKSTGALSLKKPVITISDGGYFILAPSIVEYVMNTDVGILKKAAKENPVKKPLERIKPVPITYQAETVVEVVESENVLGFIEGTDKKDEVLVITAHYDHEGMDTTRTGDQIYNGADDDGSGTVAVMEIANVFARAKEAGHGPRRSILFMTVTGEEKGLLGSDYYTKHPVIPLSQTVVNLNIDMIGRRDSKHPEDVSYVYVIGSDKLSTDLHRISETMNKKYCGLVFDYTYNDESHPSRLYYRSDHWNFAKNDVPVIFYFDGIHEDYHRVTDEVDKIEFKLLRKRTQCVFYTAWEIANREERLKSDVANKIYLPQN